MDKCSVCGVKFDKSIYLFIWNRKEEEMKVIIQDIPEESVGPVRIKYLENVGEKKGIAMCQKGSKINIEINDQELAERILKEKCNFVF